VRINTYTQLILQAYAVILLAVILLAVILLAVILLAVILLAVILLAVILLAVILQQCTWDYMLCNLCRRRTLPQQLYLTPL
jgi:hypothetical protein